MQSPQTPIARVVLLGASNVVLGFRSAVQAAHERLGGPLEVFTAHGHGRSYGSTSNVFGRALPAISTCGLWRSLAERPALPTFAIVTDIGNDIAYGRAPAEIEPWVELCLAQLAEHRARVVLIGLPLDAMERLPPWKFRFFSSLFFPHRRIVRNATLDAARDVDARLERLARTHGAARIAPQLAWYGHDPIHVRRRARAEAWRAYTAGWNASQSAARVDGAWSLRGSLIASDRVLFGRPAGREQPCASLAGGTRFFLY